VLSVGCVFFTQKLVYHNTARTTRGASGRVETGQVMTGADPPGPTLALDASLPRQTPDHGLATGEMARDVVRPTAGRV